MAYGTPVDPVPGTVITTAYAVANILDPIRWLRLMTGNADPPGSAYALIATSVSTTAWSKVPADALAANAVTTHLGYTPVNKGGDTMTGGLAISGAASDLVVGRNIGAAGIISGARLDAGSLGITSVGGIGTQANVLALGQIQGGSFNGGTTASGTMAVARVTAGASGIDTTAGVTATGTISAGVFNGGTKTTGTVSAARFVAGSSGIDSDAAITSAGHNVQDRAWHTGTQLAATISNFAATVATLDAASVAGKIPTATPSANALPLADSSGTLNAWVTGGGGGGGTPIPTGLIAFIATGALPTGWSFYTPANGRVIVAAGSASVTNPQTFVVGNNYGPDWGHQHASNSFSVSTSVSVSVTGTAAGGASDVTGTSGTTVNGRFTAGGANALPDNHTHSLNGVSFAVSGSGSGSGTGSATGSTTAAIWIPPAHALNAIIKT